MSLLIDDWCDAQAELMAQGWVITDFSRYDPTHLVGITPTGRAFTFDAIGDTVTIDIAGKVRTQTIAKADWLPGRATGNALVATRNLLPVNQR